MSIFLSFRLRLPTLLLATVLSCVAASRAADGVLSTLDPREVAPSAIAQPQAASPPGLQGVPGTPYSISNPGGQTVVIPYRASSAQPAPFSSSDTVDAVTTAAAGDVVILSDPAGTDDPSNWAAVFRFLNPNDPTGADGLLADDVEGFDTSNVGSGGFANFKLFPNTIYLADVASGDTGRAGMYEELGLGGNGILPGQTAIFYYTVDVTGSGGTGPGGGSVPEPSTFLLIGLGGGALIAGRLRRYGRARA